MAIKYIVVLDCNASEKDYCSSCSGLLEVTQICADASCNFALFLTWNHISGTTFQSPNAQSANSSLSPSLPCQRNRCRLRVVSPWVSTSAISPVSAAGTPGCQHVWWVRWHKEMCVVRHVSVSRTLKLTVKSGDEPRPFSSPTDEANTLLIIMLCDLSEFDIRQTILIWQLAWRALEKQSLVQKIHAQWHREVIFFLALFYLFIFLIYLRFFFLILFVFFWKWIQ